MSVAAAPWLLRNLLSQRWLSVVRFLAGRFIFEISGIAIIVWT